MEQIVFRSRRSAKPISEVATRSDASGRDQSGWTIADTSDSLEN